MPRFPGTNVTDGSIIGQQNALIASTLPKLSSEIADNVFKDLPFFMWIRQKGKVLPWDTGESLELPLMYGENEYAGAYDDYELMDAGPPSGFANAVFMRAKYRVPIMYAATTLSANSGRSQIYNLINKLKMQATKSLEKVINDDLMREDGSNDGDSKRITGLNYMLEAKAHDLGVGTTSQDNIVGGINKGSATYSGWWNNHFVDGTASSACTEVLELLRESVVGCTDGNDGPDLGLCDTQSYLQIENEAFTKRRFVNAAAAELGFANVVYNGVTYMYDKNIDDYVSGDSVAGGFTYHINSDHIRVAVCTDRNFQVIPPQYDVNQDCYIGAVITHIQLICDKLSSCGCIAGTCAPA